MPIIFLLSGLVCLVVSTRSLAELPEQVGLTVFGFFQKGFSAIGNFFSDTLTSIIELRQLRNDYTTLAAKLERYTTIERGLVELRTENERLKVQLGLSPSPQYARISARVIAKDPAVPYPTIIIDKGLDDGIRKDMPVLAFQDGQEGLVGRVIQAGHGSSVIVPVYDSSSFIACRLEQSRHEGLVSGAGSVDAPLVMRYVKKRAKDEIQFGDLVVTSGYEMNSIYPAGLAVARVSKTRIMEYQTSIELDLEPVVDFSTIEYLFVLKAEISNPVAESRVQ